MSHGEVLPDNTDDARFAPSDRAPAQDAPPEARMAATPGEPGLSKVPSITQAMLRVHPEHEDKPEPEPES